MVLFFKYFALFPLLNAFNLNSFAYRLSCHEDPLHLVVTHFLVYSWLPPLKGKMADHSVHVINQSRDKDVEEGLSSPGFILSDNEHHGLHPILADRLARKLSARQVQSKSFF
jgi:hypothetical protein